MKQRSREFDPALVEWVYDSRFVLVSQLQRRFPEWLPSHRTAQRHVARLVQAGLLAQAPVRSTGPHFPAILYATGRGIRLVKDTYASFGLPWRGPTTEERKARGLALDSVMHEVLVSEFDLAMYRTAQNRDDLVLLNRERRYFRGDRRLTYRDGGENRHIVPDAGYLLATHSESGRRLLPMHFLELENGTHSVAKVRQKLQAYAAWARNGAAEYLGRVYGDAGEPGRNPTFQLLFVAHDKYGTVSDERRLIDLLIHASQLPRAVRDSIWLTTAEELCPRQKDAAPLDADAWIRCRDAGRWLRTLPRSTGEFDQTSTSTAVRQFTAQQLPTLARHSLFPRQDKLGCRVEQVEFAGARAELVGH